MEDASSHFGDVVPNTQLLAEPFVECKRTGFGAAIVNRPSQAHEASHASNGYDVTVVLSDHIWQDFLHHEEVRNCVDVEDLTDSGFGFLEEGSFLPTPALYEDCWVAMLSADFGCGGANAFRGCHVCVVECYIFVCVMVNTHQV